MWTSIRSFAQTLQGRDNQRGNPVAIRTSVTSSCAREDRLILQTIHRSDWRRRARPPEESRHLYSVPVERVRLRQCPLTQKNTLAQQQGNAPSVGLFHISFSPTAIIVPGPQYRRPSPTNFGKGPGRMIGMSANLLGSTPTPPNSFTGVQSRLQRPQSGP